MNEICIKCEQYYCPKCKKFDHSGFCDRELNSYIEKEDDDEKENKIKYKCGRCANVMKI